LKIYIARVVNIKNCGFKAIEHRNQVKINGEGDNVFMLRTAKDYIESLRKLKLNLYLLGEKVENWVDNPIIRPSINAVAMTYKLAMNLKMRLWQLWTPYSQETR